jgi:hypothetical protein
LPWRRFSLSCSKRLRRPFERTNNPDLLPPPNYQRRHPSYSSALGMRLRIRLAHRDGGGGWRAAMEHSPPARRNARTCEITSRARRNITESKPFRRNIWSFYTAVGWNTTSGISGEISAAPPGLRPVRGGLMSLGVRAFAGLLSLWLIAYCR